MKSKKKTFEELSIIDDFLMNAAASSETVGEEFCKTLISALLNRRLGKLTVHAQSIKTPVIPTLRGIRMDVEVKEESSLSLKSIYDLEPHRGKDADLLRHNRFYQAMTDSRQLRSGKKDF